MTSNRPGNSDLPHLLTCFGVGDGWPCPRRFHSSFLYRFGEGAILVDCGESVSRSFKASGLSYDLIDRIFISHLHFDHFGGFFMFIQGLWLEGRTKELTVHMPIDGIEPTRQLLKAACIFEELLPFRLRFEPLQAKKSVTCQQSQITPFLTSHLHDAEKAFGERYPQRYEAFSFLIETPRCRIGHSADIGAVEDLQPLTDQPLDCLVCELAHVTPEKLFHFLARRSIKYILFTHLSRECLTRFETLRKLALEILGPDRVGWADDGQEIDLTSASVSQPYQLTALATREKCIES